MTMGGSWAYNPAETAWKPPQRLVQNLVEVVSKGGNFLLNVGPMGDGNYPAQAVERLKYIGQWMKRNADAIYGTTYAPPMPGFTGKVTQKGGTYYLNVFDWPADGQIVIETFLAKVRGVSLLSGEPLVYRHEDGRLEIHLTAQAPDTPVTVIAVRTEGPLA